MGTHESPSLHPVDAFNLAARWRPGPEWSKIEQGIDSEPVPSHLDTINSWGLFHIVSADKMSVRYVGNQQHGHDVGVVHADCAAPVKRTLYYFEITVKNGGLKGQMAIGFTNQQFNMRRRPGLEANRCEYRGDDGYLYRRDGKGVFIYPTFTAGDTVGAGINYASQEFFFTINGMLVGIVSKDLKGPLYPTVAVHRQNEEVTTNFGNQLFIFDIEAYEMEEKFLQQQARLEELSLPPHLSHWIVRSYLLHYGYQDTLNSYGITCESMYPLIPKVQRNDFSEQTNVYALNHRKILRQLIKNGDIGSAFQKLWEWYPQVVQDDSSVVCFLLHSQRFIEYIRVGNLEDAITYAQAQLAKYFNVRPLSELLGDVVVLLAFGEPLESCVGYLLNMSQREFVADAVNAVILSTNPDLEDPENCMQTCLEKLLRQLTLCSLEYRALTGDQGESFLLHRELATSKGKRS